MSKIVIPKTKVMLVKSFATPQKLAQWLAENHAKLDGLWLKFYKKASAKKTINYDQALDEALCYGWIDGQMKTHDEISWIQKFTPRRSKSMWSKRNQEHVARLIQVGRMQPAGLAAITAAQADGRWDQAYDSPKNMVMPVDFLIELEKNQAAYAFFQTLNKTNTYAIAWKLQTAKKQITRDRRMRVLLDMLQQGKKLY